MPARRRRSAWTGAPGSPNLSGMSEHRLRILHVSDLHGVDPAADRDPWGRALVLGEEWEKNLAEIAAGGRIDLVCFTGDLAFSGCEAEYAALTPFVDALLARVGVPRERLFVVPGNHDAARNVSVAAWKALRALDHGDERALSAWMAGGKPPRGVDDKLRAAVLKRQAAYRRWVRGTLGRPALVPGPKAAHPHLGYRETIAVAGLPFPVHVIGLDSAWLAGDGNDAGKLRLTGNQVSHLTTERGKRLDGFRLALVHHPIDDLADAAASRRDLARGVDVLLRGHQHDVGLTLWRDPDCEMREIAAGCLYEHGAFPNGCQVIDVTLDGEGKPQRFELWFRGWAEKRGFWMNDNRLYKETVDGRLTWLAQGGAPAAPKRGPGPHPRALEVFVGRERELEAIEAALLPPVGPAHPVAICAVQGMPGVGKSYLADRFAHLHGDRFPGGYLKLALEPGEARSAEEIGGVLASRLDLRWGGAGAWEGLRARLLQPPALLHVENADAEPSAVATAALVARLGGVAVIVSGRFQGLGEEVGWRQVAVRELDETKALEQLGKEVKAEIARADLARLAKELGYLPLALHLAAGYLNAGQDVNQFLRKLRTSRLALPPRDVAALAYSADRAREIVSETFELSLGLLKGALGPGAEARMASFAALGEAPLSGFGASLGASIAGVDVDAFEDLMDEAGRLSLVARVRSEQRADRAWYLHPLLAELLRGKGDGRGLPGMTEWFVARLPKLKSGHEDEQGKRWGEVHQEREALVSWLGQVPPDQAARVERAGSRYAIHSGPYAPWLAFCERLVEGTRDPKTRSDALWTLCQVAHDAGLLDRALSAAEDKAREDRARGDEREAALAVSKIADILQARGQLDEALRIRREEQLPVYERLGDVRSRAVTMGKIADILQARGQLDEALRIRREEELPVYERLGDVRERAVTMGKIADILQARGQLDEALRIRREEELPVYERLGDVRSRAVTMGKIADILQARGQLDEALRIRREEELPVYERLGDVRSRAVTMGKIADILQARGQLDEALRIRREEQLPVYERLGDVRSRAVTMGKIADILQARGQLDEALRIRREEELPVYERLGDVRSRAVTMGKIADILQARGQLDEALRIRREEELPVYERLGDVRSRAVTMGKIADILQARGQLDEALRIRREEQLPVYERLGDVRSRAAARNNIAVNLLARLHPGDRDEAAGLLRLALADAISMQIPEADVIRAILQEHGL